MLFINFRATVPYLFGALIPYALWNTGLATDDFGFLSNALNARLESNLLPNIYVSVPVLHYTHAIAYFAFGENLPAYSILKAAYLLFALYSVTRFFGLFGSHARALMGALVLLLSPIHDGATLWLTGQYLILSLSFYFLAYVKAGEQKHLQAFLLAILGSFSSYGSPPLAGGLAFMCLLDRRWRAAAILLIPNFLYSAYYVYTSVIMRSGISRLPTEFRIGDVIKSYAVQLVSFFDAGVGPSAWLKFGLSISSLGWVSTVVASATAIWIWQLRKGDHGPNMEYQLAAGSAVVALLAFGIFSLTSSYPQVAFNLGDRITLFGNLFLTALLMRYASREVLAVIAITTVSAFLGLGDHWSRWNETTNIAVTRIRAIDSASLSTPDELVFVSGLQYSRLGPMTHIDHFTAGYVVRDVFAYARNGQTPIRTASFNHRLRLADNALVDIKYGDRYPVNDAIRLYNAETGALTNVRRADISTHLEKLPKELRHWTQLFDPGPVRNLILWLMPSLAYAYPS